LTADSASLSVTTLDHTDTIYLDNAATTPVLEEVFLEMIPYLKVHYGNPSSLHSKGYVAKRAISIARNKVASIIGASDKEIIFTSGGTESNNLAIRGAALECRAKNQRKSHLITSKIEHESVLEPFRKLEKNGFEVTYLPVSNQGIVNIDNLKESISSSRTALVSVMLVNNEIGTIQPVKEISSIIRLTNKEILFHCDATQAVGKIPINVQDLGTDLVTISSHKINGPKGAGALYIRHGVRIDPLLLGGGQETLFRSGTENVYGIVGFGKACEIALSKMTENEQKVSKMRDYLVNKIIKIIPGTRYNGSKVHRIANNAHFTFSGVNGEALVMKLDEYGIATSTGSACSSRKQKSSHVLKAMGSSYDEITGSLRISISARNTIHEMDRFVMILSKVIYELRKFSPINSQL
jgi:cysteine desulfurase